MALTLDNLLTLPMLWVALIAFAVIMYVLLDGFDLGIGILFPLFSNKKDRDILIATIAPVWDGNATWLVFGGATLYGAFPLAFSILLPMLYSPIMLMLIALLLRGVSFEFRAKAQNSLPLWDVCFFVGSFVAALMQGIILGTMVQGFPTVDFSQPFPHYHWFSAFSLFTGLSLVAGYALLGATWGIMKTSDTLQKRLYPMAKCCSILVFVALVVASLWSPFIDPELTDRWLTLPNMLYLAPLPILTTLFFLALYRSLSFQGESAPFWLCISIFFLSYLGFGISTWPYIVPRTILIPEAASPTSSLAFMTVGAAILLPVLLTYTLYAYRVFKGKVTEQLY